MEKTKTDVLFHDPFHKVLKEEYAIEVKRLINFYKAEEYHQDYLKKNPTGYCHVNLNLIKENEKKAE